MSHVRRFAALAAASLLLAAGPAGAAVAYRPPVDAPVVDPFALPRGPYGPGNRGLEYATVPGTTVRSIAGGVVVFAGVVVGNRAVTVLHPDGLRSSYSWLATVSVTAGDRVAGGEAVGTAGARLHLGVRSAGTYLDPATLFTPPEVRLVPLADGPERPVGQAGAPPPEVRADPDGTGWWPWLVGMLARPTTSTRAVPAVASGRKARVSLNRREESTRWRLSSP